MMIRILVMLFLLSLGLTMVGCNTIEGAGEDIQAAGAGISSGAEETKEEINRDERY